MGDVMSIRTEYDRPIVACWIAIGLGVWAIAACVATLVVR